MFDRHVFANPLRPEVCPVLALAIYVFTQNSFRSAQAVAGNQSVLSFVRPGSEDRFSKWMFTFLRKHHVQIEQTFNVLAEDFGEHFFAFSL